MLTIPEAERDEMLRREYTECLKGLVIDNLHYAIAADENGLTIAAGDGVYGNPDKTVIRWEQVTGRIRDMLAAGKYAPQKVLNAAHDNLLHDYAQALLYYHRDAFPDGVEPVLADFDIGGHAFDEDVWRIEDLLVKPEALTEIVSRLDDVAGQYKFDPDIMRFCMYAPDRLAPQFHHLLEPMHSYTAKTEFQDTKTGAFVTGDQIDRFLSTGLSTGQGRLRIYSFYCRTSDAKARAEYLKDFFGTGGRMPALRHVDDISTDYDAKGLLLRESTSRDVALLKWPVVAKRIEHLIEGDRFMTAKDFAQIPKFERQQLAMRIDSFFHGLPEGFTTPFRDPDNDARIDDIQSALEDTETLLESMRDVLAATPMYDRMYQRRTEILREVQAYRYDTYTLFPEPETAPAQQLSM